MDRTDTSLILASRSAGVIVLEAVTILAMPSHKAMTESYATANFDES